jgi:GH25 family lysozyme M1 (1,4-beta-N-acetylmuramidase)
MLRGIDISYYQGVMRWQTTLEANIQVVTIRACDGVWLDPQFKNNAQAPAPLRRQAYINFYVNQLPDVQIEAFTNIVRPYSWDYAPMLDLEPNQNHSHIIDRLWAGLSLLEAQFGYAVFYTNLSKLRKLNLPPKFTRFGLHIARWNASDPGNILPWFPTNLFAWQFKVVPGKDYGTTPTSTGRPYPNIDLDVIY